MFKLKNGYLLHEIAGTPYLLPYGQNVADFRRSIRLNESGVLLYHALEQGTDEETLLAVLISHYQAEESDIPALKEDISHFLLQLEAANILFSPVDTNAKAADYYFQIGSVIIAYHGPGELLVPSFRDFSCEHETPDLTIHIVPSAPEVHVNGDILVRTDEMTICKNEDSYLFLYPSAHGISEMHVTSDGSHAALFCPKPHDSGLSEKIFHALRFCFLICAQRKGIFALHSASILYQNKAWLFSGPSGSGKSTHTALWNRCYQTPYLNGDLNLLGFEADKPIVYGSPWCGTSGYYTTSTVPLGGITFLKQAPTDALLPLSTQEISLRTIQRLVSPSWTEDMLLMNLSFVERLSRTVPFFHLQCTKENSAAAVIKQAIDGYV